MRILGVDPGTIKLGYGLVKATGPNDIQFVSSGAITTTVDVDSLKSTACSVSALAYDSPKPT